MKKTAVFISGSGTNLQALIDYAKQGKLMADISLVISNKPDAYGIKRAQEAGIKTLIINNKEFASREEHEAEIEKHLKENQIEFLVLAGYMRLLTSNFVKNWHLKIINLHPALLPSFPGIKAIEQAYEYGVRVTGVSTIFVDEGVDTGIIILQDTVKIETSDTLETLAEKIHALEHKLLPLTVNVVASEKYIVEGRKLMLLEIPAIL